ncbi:MAG TPA: alpha/beta hydrolase fold domain-containing protein [Puia sp.]|nr:alpha/beta hydrolase fold domain-containing protein [Puia sp.]
MLDKELQTLLKISRRGHYPAFGESGIEQARENVKRLSAITALPSGEVEKVENYNIPANDGPTIAIRMYRPKQATRQLPVLLYFHGGGFVLYDIDDYDSFCRFIAASAGIVVASVDYRRAPEHRFPSPYADALSSLEWLFANAGPFQIDPGRIAVGGDSVGGNLAAFLANNIREHGIHLHLQLLIYPVLVFNRPFPSYEKYGSEYFLDTGMMKWFWDLFSDPSTPMDKDERLHPYLKKDLRNTPPAVIAVAEYDILRDEALQYYDRLIQQGNKAALLYFDNLGHNFILLGGRVKACRMAIEKIAAALQERLLHTSTF